VLAVGVAGALIARFQPHGMARALLATALAQALITVSAGLAAPASGPLEILMCICGLVHPACATLGPTDRQEAGLPALGRVGTAPASSTMVPTLSLVP
jgi:hypothetical protein